MNGVDKDIAAVWQQKGRDSSARIEEERQAKIIEKEKQESAYMLRIVWPEICGGEESEP